MKTYNIHDLITVTAIINNHIESYIVTNDTAESFKQGVASIVELDIEDHKISQILEANWHTYKSLPLEQRTFKI